MYKKEAQRYRFLSNPPFKIVFQSDSFCVSAEEENTKARIFNRVASIYTSPSTDSSVSDGWPLLICAVRDRKI